MELEIIMEVQIFIRFEVRDVTAADWVETMLSDDPPIFEDELPESCRYLFDVIEDFHTPDNTKRIAKKIFDISFLMGSSWRSDVQKVLELISSISDKPIWCYYWMDEDEGFLATSIGKGTIEIKNWKEDLKSQGIKRSASSDIWIYKYFSFLAQR